MMFRIFKEFRDFSIKGNMVDIAVGMILGAAFNGVINTLVTKVLMPPFTFFTEDVNFVNSKFILRQAVIEGGKVIKEQVAIEYGVLITQFINFIIVAVCVFFIVKVSNRLREKSMDPKNKQVSPPENIQLLDDMKGIMQEQNTLLESYLKKNSK